MRALLCVLVFVGLLLPAMSHKANGYSDSWAVEVAGGETKAKELASKHGFTFRGQVGSLRNMYHFEMPENGGKHAPHMTAALEAEETVEYVEQQHYRKMSKKRPY